MTDYLQVEQANTCAAEAQFSDRMYAEVGDGAPRVLSVQASHCQSDVRYDVFSRNHQCTCVALTFLANHSEGIMFKMPDLDRVLEEGDALYVGIKMQLITEGRFHQDLLTMDEVPLSVSTLNQTYYVQKSDVMMGYLRARGTPSREGWWIPLPERLQCLSTDVSHALLMVSPECIAVFRDRSGRYGFFDSHSRTADGLPHPTGDGTAVILTFTHLSDMTDRILQLFWERSDEAGYEFMPVSFETGQQSGQLPSLSVCEQASQVISALPESGTNVGAKVNLVGSGAKNQEKIDKINKQRRRKEMHKTTDSTKQRGGPKDPTASHVMRKHKKRDYERNRYVSSLQFQTNKKKAVKEKYKQDPHFRNKKKDYMARRYKIDKVVQSKKKAYMVRRYSTDTLFQRRMKEYMVRRYSTDTLFQRRMKEYMIKRYAGDSEFRAHHILRCTLRKTQKCVGDAAYHVLHRLQCALKIKKKYKPYIHHSQKTPQPLVSKVMESAIHAFRCKIQKGPTHVCTVCHRALFPDQVRVCNRTRYDKNVHVAASCLTGKYVHACDSACSDFCVVPEERKQEWICHTCDSHLKRGHMPSIASANKLELQPIPTELVELNVLERQLIAKIVPFAKIVALPKGQQKAVHGAIVCVPSEVEQTVNSLPRPRSASQLLQVKLKRHIKFKGYQHFHTVNMHNVLAALSKLKAVHSEYRDISIRESAIFESHLDEEGDDTENQQEVDVAEQPGQVEQQVSVEEHDELRPGLTLDTCMQPPDIGQEILSYGEGIFSIAPAQGKKPVGFFKIPKLEAMAFPVQFPTGQNTIDEARQISLSPSMYFKARLFSVDTRLRAIRVTYSFRNL